MQVHTFTTEHAFIYRVILITLHLQAAEFILAGYYPTSHTTIAASRFICFLVGQILIPFYAAANSVACMSFTNVVSEAFFIASLTTKTMTPTAKTAPPKYINAAA